MAKTSSKESLTKKSSFADHISKREIIGILICLVAIIVGLVAWQATKTSGNKLMAGWANYNNSKYGLAFSYPSTWGRPEVTEVPQPQGKFYNVGFSKIHRINDNPDSIILRFDSSDLNTCVSPGCSSLAVTKDLVQKALKSKSKAGIYKSDNDSYSTIFSDPKSKASVLTIVRAVSLPKMKASAVTATYNISQPGDNCPQRQPAANGTKNCITDDIYNDVLQVVKSVHHE